MSGVFPQPTQFSLPPAPWRADAPPAAISPTAASSARTAFPLPLAFISRVQDTALSGALQERDGVRGEAFAPAGVAEPVCRRRPHVDLAASDRRLEPLAHRL